MNISDIFGSGWDDPKSQMMLGLAQGLMQGGMPGAIQGMNDARAGTLKEQLARMQIQGAGLRNDGDRLQIEQQRRQAEQEQAMRAAAASAFRSPAQANAMSMGPRQDGSAVPPVRPGLDWESYASNVEGIDPMKGLAIRQAMTKESGFDKIDPKSFTPASLQKFAQSRNYGDLVPLAKLEFQNAGGTIEALDPYTGRSVNQVQKTGNPFDDLILSNGAGGYTPNQPLLEARKAIAKSGAANTSVKIENKMGEGIAAQVGPMLKESASAADGAVKQIDAANRIDQALDRNKMYTGTGASIRLKGAQLADTLGFGGKDTAEKITNTRQAVQGLAQLTLQGRAQMRGQGAITESEGALAERAISGDIELTAGELRILTGAARRSAKHVQAEHARKVQVLQRNPNLADMVPFYNVQPVPAEPVAAAAPKPNYRFENGRLVKVE